MDLNEMRHRINRAERELMPAARVQQWEKMQSDAQAYLKTLTDQRKTEEAKLLQEIEGLKPEVVGVTDEEKKNRPETTIVGSRKLDSRNVTVMNYLTKTTLSRLSAEAGSPEEFLKLIEELATNDNEQFRYILLDSYHDIVKMGQSLFPSNTEKGLAGMGFKNVEHKIRDHYKAAKESLKSPEQIKYEQAVDEVELKKSRLASRSYPVEKNIQEFLGELSGKINWTKNKMPGGQSTNVW
ncbi:hypothetical protein [Bacillus sp. CHD6a]|uniref:hypothetical protein n=1 Tax=Bacillus sp. CHD6a TaxID=1643452 RepID=UPI0006CC3E16|nr:hypothetical protein [Bacillus sp. CHD6a]KPB03073.1 hypothetical protein AAV98_19235 [Bacillus sp. CHD6a]